MVAGFSVSGGRFPVNTLNQIQYLNLRVNCVLFVSQYKSTQVVTNVMEPQYLQKMCVKINE